MCVVQYQIATTCIQNASEVLQVTLANTVVAPLVSKLKPFQKKVIPIGNLK